MSAALAATRKRNKGNSRSYHAPEAIYSNGVMEMDARRRALGLALPSVPFKIRGSCKKQNLMGDDKCQVSTMRRYGDVWDGYLNFCYLIGDYDSAMMFHRTLCPRRPPSASVHTLVLYMRFRVLRQGTPLTPHGTAPDDPNTEALTMKDVLGNPIYCHGQWTGKSTVKLFASAITKLHQHYPLVSDGPYIEACPACQLNERTRRNGCCEHAGAPQVTCSGMPTSNKTFKMRHSQYVTYAVQEYKAARKSFAFLPNEVRDIHDYCMLKNNKYYFMVWTIMILGIKQFRRIEEVLMLEYDDFDDAYFAVTENNVEALALTVFGKSDAEMIHLLLWDDKQYPEFSPTRAVLAWLSVSGITSSYIFPTKELIGHSKSPTEHLSYHSYLEEIKFFCTEVLKKDLLSPEMKKQILGTHILRRTGYQFAFWGYHQAGLTEIPVLGESSIVLSARHTERSDSIATYIADAATLYELVGAVAQDDPRFKVGNWKSIHLHTHSAFLSITLDQKRWLKPLPQLVDWYMSEKLQVAADLPIRRLSHRLLSYNPMTLSNDEEATYKLYLQEDLPPGKLPRCMTAIETFLKKGIEKGVRRELELMNLSNGPGQTGPTAHAPNAAVDRAARAPNPNAVIDTKGYQKAAAKTGLTKPDLIAILYEADQDCRRQQEEGKNLVQPYSTFIYSARRTTTCIDVCSFGDVANFLATHPNYARSKYKCAVCGGKPS